MRIAIDAGGLCAASGQRFGNYIFSYNLIQAILNYDKNNYYALYSLCQKPAELQMTGLSDYRILLPRRLWMKARVSLEEFLQNSHVFLALNQAIPLYTRAKIIAFSHGLSYRYFPHYYRDIFFRMSIYLGEMTRRTDAIIVSSRRVKQEMAELFPENKNVHVIPFGVPVDMVDIVRFNKSRKKYFLYVGMNHPIKNISFLKKIIKEFPGYKLYTVNSATRAELKNLYADASALLTASHYESFNLPVLEALSVGTPVVGLHSAIIPELAPYVNVANDKYDFVEKVKKVLKGEGVKFDSKTIIKKFSWKHYVSELTKLYNNRK